MSQPYVVVVGGANMDICGTPAGPLVPADSNVGSVRLSHGGVGRNIAHNLALLGVDVKLLTCFGGDPQADSLKAGCADAGIDILHSLTVDGGATSTYLYVTDEHGEMQVAINDMGILKELTRERLEARLGLIRGSALTFVDTNVERDTVAWLCDHAGVPLFCDPISTAKARKLRGVLGKIHTLKPNRLEAEELAGMAIRDDETLARAAQTLLDKGLRRAFVSLGAAGLLCAEAGRSERLPMLPCTVVNTTGAGDAMAAALAWAYLHDCDVREAGLAGLAASALAVEVPTTINLGLSERALRERMALAGEAGA